MSDQNGIYQNTEFSRIQLYSEIGKFFHADGRFDEAAFRRTLRESLEKLKGQFGEDADFAGRMSEWISSYLSDIMDYLEEKGMPAATLKLIHAALDEYGRTGLKNIVISADHLNHLFSIVTTHPAAREEKKVAPDIKRKKIFEAALKVFAEKGYSNSTIDEIASISNVGKGSVYRYFKSKEDLLTQLLKEHYQEIFKMMNDIFSREQDVLKQIEEMIRAWVKFIEKNPIVYRLIQSEAITRSGAYRGGFYDNFITQFPMFKERIVSLNQEKMLKTTNFYTVHYGILGFIDGVVHKWFRRGMDYPLSDEIPVILEVLFSGFAGESQLRGRNYWREEDK